jgi:hypothetical protein
MNCEDGTNSLSEQISIDGRLNKEGCSFLNTIKPYSDNHMPSSFRGD